MTVSPCAGLELAVALEKLYPGKVDWKLTARLIGSDDVIRRIQSAEDPRLIEESFQQAVADFVEKRKPYLLY